MKNLFLIFAVIFLVGCEGDFAGNRPFFIEQTNGTYRIKTLEVEGTLYLTVLNTNYRGVLRDGSLHFYNLPDPRNIQFNEHLSLRIPSNVSDFYYYDAKKELYILDRNENRLLIYKLESGRFQPVFSSGTKQKEIELFSNPQNFVYFERGDEARPTLAISCYNAGSIQFFDLTDGELINESEVEGLIKDGVGRKDRFYLGSLNQVGARLHMSSRTERITDYSIQGAKGISGGASIGRGINDIVYLGGDEQVIVAASFVDSALFGFHYSDFDNTSNMFWNLRKYEKGYKSGDGEKIPGTEAYGFRALVKDADNNLYASGRFDNSIYKIDSEPFFEKRQKVNEDRNRAKDLNTTFFETNTRPYRLQIDFDTDPTDKIFPRLGAMTVNAQELGTADRAFVIGLEAEDDRGMTASRLYLVDLDAEEILDTYVFKTGASPQALYLLEDEDILYVSLTGSDQLGIFDVSGDEISLVKLIGEARD